MKIIDTHIHTNLLKPRLIEIARTNNIDFSIEGLRKEMKENNVMNAVSITDHFEQETPIALKEMTEQRNLMASIIPCTGINPNKISPASIKITEEAIRRGDIHALKIYSGYYHYYAYDKTYYPFYKLAAKYGIPVIIHTGDTLSEDAKLKYAHPLTVDEVAVDFKNTDFIIAHLGYPWIEDAAAVVYKNPNVYTDLSGMMIGKNFPDKHTLAKIRSALHYIEDPSKILYGSDWPISPMKRYIEFVMKIVPKQHHKKVFSENAIRLFRI